MSRCRRIYHRKPFLSFVFAACKSIVFPLSRPFHLFVTNANKIARRSARASKFVTKSTCPWKSRLFHGILDKFRLAVTVFRTSNRAAELQFCLSSVAQADSNFTTPYFPFFRLSVTAAPFAAAGFEAIKTVHLAPLS